MTISQANYLTKIIVLFTILLTHKVGGQILISQYYEGMANNKFLEITNISSSTITADNGEFYICLFSNNAATNPQNTAPSLVTKISSTIMPGESIVFKNALAAEPFYAVNTGLSALIGAFNGNDLIILSTSKDENSWENRIDVLGNDTDWGIDKCFYRQPDVVSGTLGFEITEWEEVPLSAVISANMNSVEYLGHHQFNCQPATTASQSPLVQTLSDNNLSFNWSPGDGQSRLVIMGENTPNALPLSGESYQANSAFGLGASIGNGYVVFNGWQNETMITNLKPSTTYTIRIIEFSCQNPLYFSNEILEFELVTLAPIPRIFTDLLGPPLNFGIINPGESSELETAVVSWQNVISPITVHTNLPFELSLDGGIWLNQLMLNPIDANDSATIFIRYRPGLPNGNAYENLSITTLGAETISYQLEGTAFPNFWLNEFHYDNMGADEAEFVEVVLQYDNQYSLEDFYVYLINGESGVAYETINLANFIQGEKAGNYTVYYKPLSAIQNAGPTAGDGFVLSIKNKLVQFLSYEGIFVATEGPAAGKSSIDIGLMEDEETSAGFSIQLEEQELISGRSIALTAHKVFNWVVGEASPGEFNNNQVLPVEMAFFSLHEKNDVAYLKWKTLSEINNAHFEVQKSDNGFDFMILGRIAGAGTSSSPVGYSFIDSQFYKSAYFRLKQVDIDGNIQFSQIEYLKKRNLNSLKFNISPNPFSEKIEILSPFLNESTGIVASIFSIQGKKLLETKGDLVKIKAEINQCLGKLPTGLYVLELGKGRQREKHKLLKE